MSPRILVVQHEDDCPPALVGTWLTQAGAVLDVRRPYAGDPLPAPAGRAEHDGLVILGGPMGADDDARHDWLGPLKALVRAAATAGLPTLGICLGHQLIASALGGSVDRNPLGQQLGLLPVGWTPAAADDELFGPLTGPGPRRGVQWNDDAVLTLPPEAVLLAQTPRGEVQVVRFAQRMWGVQLHPEVDLAVVESWAASDWGSHQARGIDQPALLREIGAARAELDAAWQPLAAGFAAVVRTRAEAASR